MRNHDFGAESLGSLLMQFINSADEVKSTSIDILDKVKNLNPKQLESVVIIMAGNDSQGFFNACKKVAETVQIKKDRLPGLEWKIGNCSYYLSRSSLNEFAKISKKDLAIGKLVALTAMPIFESILTIEYLSDLNIIPGNYKKTTNFEITHKWVYI